MIQKKPVIRTDVKYPRNTMNITQAARIRLAKARDRHHVTTAVVIDAMLKHFESLHVDWQAAMIRGEKIEPKEVAHD